MIVNISQNFIYNMVAEMSAMECNYITVTLCIKYTFYYDSTVDIIKGINVIVDYSYRILRRLQSLLLPAVMFFFVINLCESQVSDLHISNSCCGLIVLVLCFD